MELISSSEPIIGVSVSEPLSSHLNVDFVCLSVMDRLLTINHFWLLRILRIWILRYLKIHSRDEDMNHGQSNSSMATTRTETTRGLTYSVARALDITAWQSVDAFCLCCLTHSACVKVTGLQPLLTTAWWRLPVHAISTICSMCWTSLCVSIGTWMWFNVWDNSVWVLVVFEVMQFVTMHPVFKSLSLVVCVHSALSHL